MPSFSSIRCGRRLFASPNEPSGLTRYFGTRKRDRPRTPSGAPSVRASTIWQIWSAASWSPKLMKNLGARDPVGAVVLGHRLCAGEADVGTGVRLGHDDGRCPFAGHKLGEEYFLQRFRRMRLQHPGAGPAGGRQHGEGKARAVGELAERRLGHLWHRLAAPISPAAPGPASRPHRPSRRPP